MIRLISSFLGPGLVRLFKNQNIIERMKWKLILLSSMTVSQGGKVYVHKLSNELNDKYVSCCSEQINTNMCT